ncbi:MAG: heparinase II/III family protein, partial [Luteolibacter sp.]
FNYFDTRPGRANQNLVFWFARETRRPDLASAEWARVRKSAETGDKSYGRGLVFALLWSPTTETTDQPTTGPLLWQGGGHQPVAVFRTAWNDPAATWLAIKGGTANYSHGHMDAGTFVIEANGVRWAIDPEIEDYLDARNRTGLTHAQFFSYAQDSARWAHFRLGPDGHNILRFNHARQNVDGQATIGPMRKSSEGASVEINLDTTYAGQAASVRRVASLRSDGTVMIDDTWTDLADHPSEVTWQWLTAAQASLEPGGVCLKQDGQTLHLRVIGAEPNRIELQDVAPLLDAKFDAPLPGYTRIVIRVTSPTGARGSLRVIAGSALPPTETPPSR